jgi:hypothetical protein
MYYKMDVKKDETINPNMFGYSVNKNNQRPCCILTRPVVKLLEIKDWYLNLACQALWNCKTVQRKNIKIVKSS